MPYEASAEHSFRYLVRPEFHWFSKDPNGNACRLEVNSGRKPIGTSANYSDITVR
jgi:hypothetical protein